MLWGSNEKRNRVHRPLSERSVVYLQGESLTRSQAGIESEWAFLPIPRLWRLGYGRDVILNWFHSIPTEISCSLEVLQDVLAERIARTERIKAIVDSTCPRQSDPPEGDNIQDTTWSENAPLRVRRRAVRPRDPGADEPLHQQSAGQPRDHAPCAVPSPTPDRDLLRRLRIFEGRMEWRPRFTFRRGAKGRPPRRSGRPDAGCEAATRAAPSRRAAALYD